ncbi:RNA polymerase sigma factor, partial [Escherichia coli]|uniref:RNA polymerase sigma factor n=1 Tax=Escherichia coli TaxID=562 RepID=UPI0039E1A2B7
MRRLERALDRLKPLTRNVFLARRLDGYSYVEIAERTGLSVRAVEKQMSRAIQQLAKHMREP